MRWLFCAALTMGFTATTSAEEQLWVAVGSYRDAAYAEEARQRANDKLREAFTVSISEIGGQRWYRVVTGPYLTRGIAEFSLVEAQQAGFEDAWMLVTDSSDVENYDDYADYENYEDEYGPLPNYEGSESSPPDGYPDIDSLLSTSTPSGEEKPARAPREVVGSAPEGYGLHKLRRGGD